MAAAFEARHGITYRRPKREVFASFEVGCLIALIDFYCTAGLTAQVQNLQNEDSSGTAYFRYHTTPNGNPHNFSWILLRHGDETFQVRQQVRIQSHLDPDIRFTPDIVVLRSTSEYLAAKDPDYAGGKRRLFCVAASDVIAAHECKSMQPFPELLVSFVGMLVAAHPWLPNGSFLQAPDAIHLAPTLFVGGTARGLDRRMVAALCKVYPMNAILGLHEGSWNLASNCSLRRCATPSPEAVPA